MRISCRWLRPPPALHSPEALASLWPPKTTVAPGESLARRHRAGGRPEKREERHRDQEHFLRLKQIQKQLR